MNELNGGEALVRMLKLYGVEVIFGLCGDTTLPFYDALYRTGDGITHLLSRDERHAGYMADCYARVSGKVGVCEGPSGGGATYILPGVVEANESSIPVLAITSDISVSGRGRYTLTELDQEALFRPLTKWNRVIDRAVDLPGTVRAAFRNMTTGRPGAAHIGLPFDVQKDPLDEADIWAEPELGCFPARRTGPDLDDVDAAADLLVSAKNPLFICGGGVVISGGESALQALAESLEAPVATTVSGQGSLAEIHPLAVGVVGSNGGTVETRGSGGRSRPDRLRQLPRRVGDDGALAASRTRQQTGHPYRRRSGGHRRQLPRRGIDRRRCAVGAGIPGRRGIAPPRRAARRWRGARPHRRIETSEIRGVSGVGRVRTKHRSGPNASSRRCNPCCPTMR